MTRFERDVKEIQGGNGIEVLTRRKAELAKLEKKGRCEKKGFRRQCIPKRIINEEVYQNRSVRD